MHVRLSQIDGKLPNLALMKIAAWHRDQGDILHFYSGDRAATRNMFEPDYGRVYGSTIFAFSAPLLAKFRAARRDLRAFARWVITGLYRAIPFEQYDVSIKRHGLDLDGGQGVLL